MDERMLSGDAIERWEGEGGALGGANAPRGHAAADPRPPGRGRSRTSSLKMVGRFDEELPSEIADWITKPFARFFKIAVAAAALLLAATIAALALANSGWSAPFLAFWETPLGLNFGDFEFSRSLRHWINDGLMTLFFFVVALELKRELVLGELRHIRTAALSLAGALGGMLIPACVFLVMMRGQDGTRGWGAVMATDTAFALGCLAVLGSRVPSTLRLFILSLAIFDDVGAILVVAIGYSEGVHWIALAAAVCGVIGLVAMAYIGIRSVPVYFVFGAAIWFCFDASGIHPTVAGVVLGLLTPTGRWVTNIRMRAIFGRVLARPLGEHADGESTERKELQLASRAARESVSPVERLELMLHPWVGFGILPIFALANAGVAFSGTSLGEPLLAAIIASFVLGKPLGVLGMSWLAVRLGVATRPKGLTWPLIAGGALLTGIGFTMALFIAGLAFTPAQFDVARIGILLASVISAGAGTAMLFWLTSSKAQSPFERTAPPMAAEQGGSSNPTNSHPENRRL